MWAATVLWRPLRGDRWWLTTRVPLWKISTRPKTNTRVTSRQLAYHALSVNRSRFPLCSQIAVDGPPTDLEGLPNLLHSETTVMQEPDAGWLGFRRPLGPAVIAALPLGHGNPSRLSLLAIFVLNLG